MKTVMLILFMLVPVIIIYSQTLSNNIKDKAHKGFEPGHLILNDSTKLEGRIRNNIRHWGTVQILQHDGRKTTYTASQLREAVIHQTRFITVEGEWYSPVETGIKLNLLQKASAAADGIQFNGNEPVGSNSGKGGYQDLFLQISGKPDSSLLWITTENADKIARNIMKKCEAVSHAINGKKVMIKDLRELVRIFNNCQGDN